MRLRVLAFGVAACGSSDARVDGAIGDVALEVPACDLTRPFDAPSLVDGVNSAGDDRWGWMAADELTIYFARGSVGGYADLYVATRAQRDAAFSGARMLETSTVGGSEVRPILTGDGLTLYMEYGDGNGDFDIDIATRTDSTSAFSTHVPVPVVDTEANEFNPWISEDGLTLYFTSDRAAFNDIFKTARPNATATFSTPVAVTELNSTNGDYMGALSRDGLEIFIGSSRDTSGANDDIFHALRVSADAPFDTPRSVSELSDAATNEYPTWVSADRCRILFTSNRGGGTGLDLWTASRPE